MVPCCLLLILSQYTYSPIGKTDPFRPYLRQPVERPAHLKPLQKWDLQQLRLVAVVFGRGAPYAMVEDPKGRGHVIRRGDSIGKNFGRVSAIRERTIEIREESYDYLGKKVVVEQEMIIPKLPVATDDDDLTEGAESSEAALPSEAQGSWEAKGSRY